MPTSVTKLNNTFIRKPPPSPLRLDSMAENRCEESLADDLNKTNNTGTLWPFRTPLFGRLFIATI